MISDEILIIRCKDNDREAQKMLFEKYANQMMATCLRYTNTREDAKDLLQDGFYKVFLSIGKFKGNSQLGTWMTRIFINLALNKKRHGRHKYDHYSFNPEYDMPVEDNEPVEDVDTKKVMSALNSLPEIYKVVLNMYAIDGMTHNEIAKQLGISEGSSKSRLSRGRVMLNTLLKRK